MTSGKVSGQDSGIDQAYEAARQAALARLERGAHLGGGPLPPRDELHDRARLR